MKERLFILLAGLVLFIGGLQPVSPPVPFAGSITPLVECQEGGVCG